MELVPKRLEGALNETIGRKACYVLQFGAKLVRFGGNPDRTNCG
jgi:hypothetical protein